MLASLTAELAVAFKAFGMVGAPIKAVVSVFGVFFTVLKVIYGVTRSAAGFINLADLKHAFAVGLTVFVATLKFGAGVLSVFAAVSADLSAWQAALAGVLSTIAVGLAKYISDGTAGK